MKPFGFILIALFSLNSFSQDAEVIAEEFIPITIEGKEAFMSTKTGEFVYRAHDKTDASGLKTTGNGVIYNDVLTHVVKKGETLSILSRKYGLSVAELKAQNELTNTGLSIGQKLKVVKKLSIKSSSPIKGTSGKETIVAKLRPGQTPASLNAPSVNITKEKALKATVVEENTSIKNKVPEKKEKIVTKKTKEVEEEVESSEKDEITNKSAVITKEEVAKSIAESRSKSFHTIKKDDTLYSIAKRYGMTVQNLKKIDGLVSNTISIGQELKINRK